MKKLLFYIFCVVFIFLGAACGQSMPGTALLAPEGAQAHMPADTTPQAKKYTIALVMKTLTNPFFVEMEKGARKAEKEL